MGKNLLRTASFSEDGTRRYMLGRSWGPDGPRKTLGLVMLNPSKAGAEIDDPTIRKGIGFASRWGFNALLVGNLIPIVATDPWDLPCWNGPFHDNEEYLDTLVRTTDSLAVAWGSVDMNLARRICFAEHAYRFRELIADGRELLAIGKTKNGSPLHPSRAPYTDSPIIWRAANG